MRTYINDLGNFLVKSGKLRISDPCYEKDTWCAGTIENAKNGTWKARSIMLNAGSWGIRCAGLQAKHIDAAEWDFPFESEIEVGVDSGQAGIFDEKYFLDDNYQVNGNFYDTCCNITLAKGLAGVIEGGAVSSSGYGDGSYEAKYNKNKDGQIISVELVFLNINEEQE